MRDVRTALRTEEQVKLILMIDFIYQPDIRKILSQHITQLIYSQCKTVNEITYTQLLVLLEVWCVCHTESTLSWAAFQVPSGHVWLEAPTLSTQGWSGWKDGRDGGRGPVW